MTIGVVGCGIVGRSVAQVCREKGHRVLCNDSHIMLDDNFSKRELAQQCNIIFICVPTPQEMHGEHLDTDIVEEVLTEFQKILGVGYKQDPPLLVVKSTMPLGSMRALGKHFIFPLVYNPEFLRENRALLDFRYPMRIVIGAEKPGDARGLMRFYRDWDCPKYVVSYEEAELVKLLSNTFLTLKVAFSVDMHQICRKAGVNEQVVYQAVTDDKRVARSHLNPALGPVPADSKCLPKDVLGLRASLIEKYGVCSSLLDAAIEKGLEE